MSRPLARSMKDLSSTMGIRRRSLIVVGGSSASASGCSREWRRMPSGRCARWNRRIISTVDPEMRHGRKSESQRFDGFKLHVAVTNSEEPLITAVDVGNASGHDGAQAKEL